jgi:hypothetical protein
MEFTKQNPGRIAGALILIGLGVFFLFGQAFRFDFLGTLWPLVVLLPGLAFLIPALTGDRRAAPLVFPAVIITGTAAILFLQNWTGHWESWAYAWTLYPALVGLGLVFVGQRTDNPRQVGAGRGMITWGLVAFVIFFAFFEGMIFNNFAAGALRYLVPLVLIGLGAALLFRRSASHDEKRKIEDHF